MAALIRAIMANMFSARAGSKPARMRSGKWPAPKITKNK